MNLGIEGKKISVLKTAVGSAFGWMVTYVHQACNCAG